MFNTQKTTGSGRLRKLRTGALVSTLALTTFGLGTAVSADEVSNPAPTEQTQTQAQPQASQTQEAQPVTQQMVDDAQVLAQEAGRSVVVAQADLDQAQANVTAIQEARSEVSSVTEQDVAQAQTEVEQNQQSLAQAQADSARASEAVQNTEKALEAARTNEAQAQANASTAKTAQDQAQTRVTSLQEGSSLADLQEQVKNLENQVQADRAALEAARQANQDTEALEKALAQSEARVESTAAAYQSALDQVNASQADLTKAKSALDASATRTEKVQVGTETITTGGKATLNKGVATSSVFKTNGVITTDAYLQALKNLAKGTGTADEVQAAIEKGYRGNNLATIAAPGRLGLDSWRDMVGMSVQVNGTDDEVYASDLTDEQLKDMALFYTALVNDLRSKVGTAPLEVTEESLAHTKELVSTTFAKRYPHFAGMTTEERLAENFYKNPRLAESTHTLTALEQTVSPEDSVTTLHFYSDLASIDSPRLSLSEYKLRLMALLGEQLYKPSLHTNGTVGKDFEWAMRLLGLDGSDMKSVGVGFDYFSTSYSWIDPAAEALVNLSTTSGTPIANPYQTLTDTITQEVPIYEERPVAADPALQLAYDNALQAANQAQAEAEQAKLDADRALEDYKTLKDARKGIVDVPALEAKLQADQDALTKAQADLASVSKNEADRAEALKQAQADLLAAQAKYAQALQNLEEAKDQLQRVESANEVAMTAFAKAQSDIVAAEKALQTSQANHKTLAEQLQNKGTLLADLDARLAQANEALAQAKQKLEAAQATYSEANTYYLSLLAALQAAQSNKDKAQDLADQAKDIQDKGGVVVPVVDQNGNIQGVVDGSNFPADARVGDIVDVKGTKYRLNADGSVSVVTADTGNGNKGTNGTNGVNGNVANMGTNQGNGQGTPVAVAYKAAPNFDRKDGAKVLPNTGEVESTLAATVGLLALAGAVGVATVSKREEEE